MASKRETDDADHPKPEASDPTPSPDVRSDAAGVDRPIAIRSQDRLRRAPFAEAIARQIRGLPPMDSAVVAVAGPWGGGKTSVLNLVEESLGDDVVSITFNPWLFSGAEDLVGRYFDEFVAELRSKNDDRLKTIATRLSDYGARLKPLSELPLLSLVPVARDAAKALQKTVELSGQITGRLERFGESTLRGQRNAVDAALREEERRFIVFIDDIDRLTQPEIRDVMRLVRLVADFPRVTYVLAFDKERVASALGEGDQLKGTEYLEKIVQELHDLPSPRAADLTALFLGGLDAAIEGLSYGPFDEAYWNNVLHYAVRPLVRTPRDAARVARAVPAAIHAVGTEVSLVDVIALETYRVLAPRVYQSIPRIADLLSYTDSDYISDWRRHEQEIGKRRFEEFLLADADRQELVRELCKWVFPGSRAFIDNTHYMSEERGRWRRARRVAHPDVLETYLSRVLPPEQLRADLVDLAFASLPVPGAFEELLETLNSEDIERLLSRLEDYESELPVPSAALIASLYNVLPRLREGRRGMFDFGAPLQVDRLVLRLMRREDDLTVRANVVTESLPMINQLGARLRLVRLVGHDPNVGLELVDESATHDLESRLITMIQGASTEDLASDKELHLVVAWAVRRSDAKQKADLGKRALERPVLAALLRASLYEGYSVALGDTNQRRSGDIPWNWLANVLGDRLSAEVKKLSKKPPKGSDDRMLEAIDIANQYASGKRVAKDQLDDDA